MSLTFDSVLFEYIAYTMPVPLDTEVPDTPSRFMLTLMALCREFKLKQARSGVDAVILLYNEPTEQQIKDMFDTICRELFSRSVSWGKIVGLFVLVEDFSRHLLLRDERKPFQVLFKHASVYGCTVCDNWIQSQPNQWYNLFDYYQRRSSCNIL